MLSDGDFSKLLPLGGVLGCNSSKHCVKPSRGRQGANAGGEHANLHAARTNRPDQLYQLCRTGRGVISIPQNSDLKVQLILQALRPRDACLVFKLRQASHLLTGILNCCQHRERRQDEMNDTAVGNTGMGMWLLSSDYRPLRLPATF